MDARACARAGSTLARSFALADLPRLREAEVRAAVAEGQFTFREFDGRPVVEGELTGQVTLTCQRCMNAVDVPLHESFSVVLTDAEPEPEHSSQSEPGGYEAVLAEDPTRFDLSWLAEEQILLGLPLVPVHERADCGEVHEAESHQSIDTTRMDTATGDAGSSEPVVTQRPFRDLRDLLRKR